MTPDPRTTALAMLDELRGLFECGTLSDARRFGAGCLSELEEAFAVDRMVNEEALRRPVVRDAVDLALLCVRAHARFAIDPIFAAAQVRQILQLAADLGGGPRATHELRDECGRSIAFADVTAAGFPMMNLPIAVLHPAAWS